MSERKNPGSAIGASFNLLPRKKVGGEREARDAGMSEVEDVTAFTVVRAARLMIGATMREASLAAVDDVLREIDPETVPAPRFNQIMRSIVTLRERGVRPTVAGVWSDLALRGLHHTVGEEGFLHSIVADLPATRDPKDPAFYAEAFRRLLNGNGAAPVEAIDCEQHETDLGNACHLAELHGRDLRFVFERGRFLAWDSRRWAEDPHAVAVQAKAKATVRQLYREAAETTNVELRKQKAKHALASESQRRIAAMMTLLPSEPGIAIKSDDLDRDPFLLNVENGTIDLRSGELRPHRRGDLMTKLAPVNYDPKAECQTFERFLLQIHDGQERVISYLQRFAGYCLTGDTSEQILTMWYGIGANGKSTLLRVLLELLGDYGRQAASEVLLMSRQDQHPTGVADMRGARLVASIEVEEGKHLAEGLVKQLTGGDRVAARFMKENFFQYVPTAKLVIVCNHRPRIRGTDWAIWRRIRIVGFNIVIPDEKQDKRIIEKLRPEFPGILAWAVRGCLAWQHEGLEPPPEVTNLTAEYRCESDSVGRFLDETCVMAPAASIGKGALLDAYQNWAKKEGEPPMSGKAFTGRMRERGFDEGKTGSRGHFWIGVGLLEGVSGDR